MGKVVNTSEINAFLIKGSFCHFCPSCDRTLGKDSLKEETLIPTHICGTECMMAGVGGMAWL